MNKKRNSIFLYEVLIRELTKATMENDATKKQEIISLIKESFKRGTLLYDDWKCYKALLGVKTNKNLAEKLVSEVMVVRSQLDEKSLMKEQNLLLNRINKLFPQGVYSSFIPNYRSMATLYQLFNSKKIPIKKKVFLEEQLIKELSQEQKDTDSKQLQPISKLAFKNFVEKFNLSYSSLLREQKELLEKYILSSFSNDIEFKICLNEEIGRLKEILQSSQEAKEIKEDIDMQNKAKQVLDILEGYQKEPISKEMIEEVLKIQQLVSEIQSNGN